MSGRVVIGVCTFGIVLSIAGLASRTLIGTKVSVYELEQGNSGTYEVIAYGQNTAEDNQIVLSDDSGSVTVVSQVELKNQYKLGSVINPKRKGRAVIQKTGGFLNMVRWSAYDVENNFSKEHPNNHPISEPLKPDGLEERTFDSLKEQEKEERVDKMFE